MLRKKSLGQHFLRSKGALHKIVEAAKLTPEDTVLEVGPGEGVLTELLLQQAGKVVAVEKDDRLIPVLQQKFASEIAAGRLELIHADILELDTRRFTLNAKRFKLVANLPYYITGQFLRKFLEGTEHPPEMMVLLLQKEVAKRIVAKDKKESILSVSVKTYGTPRYVDTVKAGSFSPPPNVDSAIIAIEGISKRFFADLPEKQFFEVLKRGFAHPRKLLASNLGMPAKALIACGVDARARAEDISLREWRCVAALESRPLA